MRVIASKAFFVLDLAMGRAWYLARYLDRLHRSNPRKPWDDSVTTASRHFGRSSPPHC
jgi:hypothetical protein